MIWLSKILKSSSIILDAERPFVVESPIHELPEDFYEDEDFGEGELEIELPPIPKGPTPEEIRKSAEEQAERIMERARTAAEGILSQAHGEAEGIRDAARAEMAKEREQTLAAAQTEGYDAGHAKGVAEAEAIKDQARAELASTLKAREDAIAALEPEMVELLGKIAGKLLGTAARINPQVVLHLVREGLAASAFTGNMSLRVSRDDYEYVAEHKDDLMEIIEGGASLEIIRDLNLAAGDCVIETEFGVIDASLNMQLEEVKENLAYLLRNPAG